MSHLLRRTKKSCLKLLRRISTSKQLFVQRLDEEDGDEDDIEPEIGADLQRGLELDVNSNCHMTEAIYEELQLDVCNQNEAVPELAREAEEPQPQEATKLDLRTKYLMSYGNYEVLATPPSAIEFERVPYKENVRYLRHTPSNSSLDLQLEEQQLQLQLQQQVPQPPPRQLPVQQQTPPRQTPPRHTPQKMVRHPCSISLGSKFEGNYHSVVIMEPPHDDFPIVKWDINGNSLDDDTCDRWEDFDTRWRQAATATANRPFSQSQSQKSSHQSSSCTLETWVDDAEPLSLELHRHENAANCNLCLRSF
ncbi:hypothetical protein KR054_004856 [Drosophila jambulina]|nr:hypothetical protein KR054_004856 [Drosophila jambulina]